MKTRSTRSLRRLLFKIRFFCDYAEQIGQLEKALARKPEKLQLDIMGSGERSPDTALFAVGAPWPVTQNTSGHQCTLQPPRWCRDALVNGRTRLIREDAKLYSRKSSKEDDEEDDEDWKDEKSDDSEVDLEEVDYAQVLQYIDHFLPVKELAGRPVDLEVLRQFGLVDSKRTDLFLNSTFASRDSTSELPSPTLGKVQENQTPKTPQSEQSNRKQ